MRHIRYRIRKYETGYRQVNVWLPKDFIEEIKSLKEDKYETMSELFERLLREAVEREKRKKIVREKTKTGWW